MVSRVHAGIGGNNTIQLHQIEYIKERLQERGREVSQGRVGLPESMEGKVEPTTDRTDPQYLEMKHLCQEEVGVLIWVASRTRPDITGSVSIAATLTTFNPVEGFNLVKRNLEVPGINCGLLLRIRVH